MFSKYDLIKEIDENPDFLDVIEVKEYLADNEIDGEAFANQLCTNVNDSVEMLMESAWESFYNHIEKWLDHRHFVDHEYPNCLNSDEFGRLIVRQVRRRVNKSWNDRG